MSQSVTADRHVATPVDATAVTPSGRRLGFLDALRGVAAIAVCLQHMGEQTVPAFRAFSLHWINLGVFGVVAFFLISGFIIPASMEKHSSLRRFWRGRLFRLYPMYLFVNAVMLIMMLAGVVDASQLSSKHAWLFLLANLTMLNQYMGIPGLVGVTWTLGLEMVFYILCSVAYIRGWLRAPFVLACVGIGVIVLTSTAGLLAHRPLPMGRLDLLASCFFGTLVYRVYKRQAALRTLWLAVPLWLCFLESFWLRFHLYPELNSQGGRDFTMANAVVSWGAAYLLFFALYALRDVELPAALQWLGKISYSFYLLADLVLTIIPRHQFVWLWMAECLIVTTLLSAMTYQWIERPAMLLGSPAAPKRALSV